MTENMEKAEEKKKSTGYCEGSLVAYIISCLKKKCRYKNYKFDVETLYFV